MPKPPLPDEVADFLRRPNYATISVVRPDGQPVSVPTWYLFEDGQVVVNMDAGRKRLDYLRADPRISLSAMDPDNWITHVSLQGRVTEMVDDHDLVDIDRIARHYTGSRMPCATVPASRRASTSTAGTAGADCETPGELARRARRDRHPAPLGRRRARARPRPRTGDRPRPRLADRAPAVAHGGPHGRARRARRRRLGHLRPAGRGSSRRSVAATRPSTRRRRRGCGPTCRVSTTGCRRGCRVQPRSRRSVCNPLRLRRARGRRGPRWASSGRSTCSSAPSPTSSSTVMSPTRWDRTCCRSSTPRASTAERGSSSRAATPGWSGVRRTATGAPLLAGDPHRTIELPGCYQQVGLACPEFDVVGFTFPGVPGVQHFAHAGSVAWGITNAMADYQDLTIESLRVARAGRDGALARADVRRRPVARRSRRAASTAGSRSRARVETDRRARR